MKKKLLVLFLAAFFVLTATATQAQDISIERLPREQLDVSPPSDRVSGAPGEMRIIERSCRSYPLASVRHRIVDIAVQEWTWFGKSVIDMTDLDSAELTQRRSRPWWWSDWMTEEEARRVSDDIAGYWAAAPDSGWILEKQNRRWREQGITARWRDFWSAAFISWVMCESGLGNPGQFQRAIAHHTYIDQAIRARDGLEPEAAFTAYDVGEAEIVPGDLLCRGSRPAYMNLEQRREQMGQGARTHCDIVVKVDNEAGLFQVIGGNVRGLVRMKLLPGDFAGSGYFTPVPYGGRRIFSHLKLNPAPVEQNAMNSDPALPVPEQANTVANLEKTAAGYAATVSPDF